MGFVDNDRWLYNGCSHPLIERSLRDTQTTAELMRTQLPPMNRAPNSPGRELHALANLPESEKWAHAPTNSMRLCTPRNSTPSRMGTAANSLRAT
jgi:hypothetical protein